MVLGGFDGTADLGDLWCLDLLPPSLRHVDGAADARSAAASHAASSATADTERRARQARQASVLHATKGAAGHNYVPIHIRVFQAGQDGATGASDEAHDDGSGVAPAEADDGTELIRRALACRLGKIRLDDARLPAK